MGDEEIKKLLKGCFRKYAYITEKYAREVANKKEKEYGKTLIVYLCKSCGAFHLTTDKRKQEEK